MSRKILFGCIAGFVAICAVFTVVTAHAAEPASDFSLQVSPSPLVATVIPGRPTDLELKIRNGSTGAEELKIDARKFTVNQKTGEVNLDDETPADISQWVSYASPKFTVKAGEWFTQRIHIALPRESGFSYSFALVITRSSSPKSIQAGRLIKGSLAVFTLINVDRPGATRKLEVSDFKTDQGIYEYLPAKLNINFKNTGNSIIQPYGNIFIQRDSKDQTPISTLPVNDKRGYILPGTDRTIQSTWTSGFPLFKEQISPDGQTKSELTADWSKITDFRIGRFTAKLVAIYNDGQRDIPIEREVTFWVVPWRTLSLITLVLLVIWFVRRKQIQRKTSKAVRKALQERDKEERAKKGVTHEK